MYSESRVFQASQINEICQTLSVQPHFDLGRRSWAHVCVDKGRAAFTLTCRGNSALILTVCTQAAPPWKRWQCQLLLLCPVLSFLVDAACVTVQTKKIGWTLLSNSPRMCPTPAHVQLLRTELLPSCGACFFYVHCKKQCWMSAMNIWTTSGEVQSATGTSCPWKCQLSRKHLIKCPLQPLTPMEA